MGFEVFSRQTPRLGTASAIYINPGGRIGVNQRAARLLGLEKGSLILLLWDKERKRLAIQKTSEDDPRAYTVNYSNSSAGFHALTFLKYIGYAASEPKTLIAEWNERDSLLEIPIPVELLGMSAMHKSGDKPKGSIRTQKK